MPSFQDEPETDVNGEGAADARKHPGQEITLPMGESYRLLVPKKLGRLVRHVVSHERLLMVTNWPGEEEGISSLKLTGKNFGMTQLTLLGDHGQTAAYPIHVVPSMAHIEAILLTQFPTSSLKVTQAADNILMVEGTVDSPAEVDPILQLLQNFVPPRRNQAGQITHPGQVINGLRIGGVMQVQLDVVIASIDRDKARELGFNFQQGNRPWFSGSQIGQIMNPPSINVPNTGIMPTAGAAAGAAPLGLASTVFFGVASDTNQLYGYIHALQTNKCFKVLANPSLVTLSGRPAKFLVGGQQPLPTAESLGVPSVKLQPFGTALVFTPFILGQGKIRLDLQPSVSRPDPSRSTTVGGVSVPGFATQEIKATVEMESGQTIVLAGLLESQMDSEIQKVPVLGSLPIVGALFRKVQQHEAERELMILATPHLVSPLQPHQYPARLPGDESRAPNDCELYLGGRPEVPLSNCELPRGARAHVNAFPQEQTAPFATWSPRPHTAAGEPQPQSAPRPMGADEAGPGTPALRPATIRRGNPLGPSPRSQNASPMFDDQPQQPIVMPISPDVSGGR